MTAMKTAKCECGNSIEVWEDATEEEMLCDWCESIKDEPEHTGHMGLYGTYWCDTCNSPYCELA